MKTITKKLMGLALAVMLCVTPTISLSNNDQGALGEVGALTMLAVASLLPASYLAAKIAKPGKDTEAILDNIYFLVKALENVPKESENYNHIVAQIRELEKEMSEINAKNNATWYKRLPYNIAAGACAVAGVCMSTAVIMLLGPKMVTPQNSK